MVKSLPIVLLQASLRLVVAGLLLGGAIGGRAQPNLPPLPQNLPENLPQNAGHEPLLIEQYPEKPSASPAFTIPVGALGFSAPGAVYLFHRQSLVSLDFLDENRLLFSFRAPGLMRRESGNDTDEKERQIRALVLALPDGRIESEAKWMVPDRARYLWMLNGGHFLLRDADGLEQGDATLKTTPLLRLPGNLLWLELDPAQQVMITNSLEPGAAQASGENKSAATDADPAKSTEQKPEPQQTLVVRTWRRQTGEVIHLARVPWTSQSADWPVNSDGYVESVKDVENQWVLRLNLFAGGSKIVGRVESSCLPKPAFVSETELLVTTCDPRGGGRLVAMVTSGGGWLWNVPKAANTMWPLLVMALGGSRFARETLVLKRPVTRYKRLLRADDLRGQMVRVMDAADGKLMLEAPIRPMLDGGGNLAISPSGRRVAILNDGAIEVFELPPAKRP